MCIYTYVSIYAVWNNNEEKAMKLKKRKRFIWYYLERKNDLNNNIILKSKSNIFIEHNRIMHPVTFRFFLNKGHFVIKAINHHAMKLMYPFKQVLTQTQNLYISLNFYIVSISIQIWLAYTLYFSIFLPSTFSCTYLPQKQQCTTE